MRPYWEVFLLIDLAILSGVVAIGMVARWWWMDRRRWRGVQPYYGNPYDGRRKE